MHKNERRKHPLPRRSLTYVLLLPSSLLLFLLLTRSILVIDNHTFIALHRAYASLAPSPLLSSLANSAAPQKQTQKQTPPSQTIFTTLPASSLRLTGYPLALARAAFPGTAHLFEGDWADLARASQAIVFERVLIAERAAAERGAMGFDFGEGIVVPGASSSSSSSSNEKENQKKDGKKEMVKTSIEATDKRLSFAPAFALPAPADWASPILAGAELIARSLRLPSLPSSPPSGSSLFSLSGGKGKKKGVTYVSTQKQGGARLREGDHQALVRELRRVAEGAGWHLYVVELGETGESEVVGSVAASSVRLSFLFSFPFLSFLLLLSLLSLLSLLPLSLN